MDKDIKELYEYNGEGQKFLFTIYEDDTTNLTLYKGEKSIEKENSMIVNIGGKGGKRIEYGTSKVKSSLPFMNYSDGNLDKRWTRIK